MKRLLLILAALVAALAGFFFWLRSRPAPEGLYLASNECLRIERNWFGEPRVVRSNGGDYKFERCRGGCAVFMKRDYHRDNDSWVYNILPFLSRRSESGLFWLRAFEIAPSSVVPGDWDLVTEYFAYDDFRKARMPQPLPSYLHRIPDDPRIEELIEETRKVRAREWSMTVIKDGVQILVQHPPLAPHSELRQLAAELASAHPDDPYFALLHMDALIAARDFRTLKAEIDRWRPRLEKPSFLRVPFRCAEHSLRAWELSSTGANAYDLIVKFEELDLATRLRGLPELMKCQGYASPVASVWAGEEGTAVPNFLDHQTLVKVMTVHSMLQMIAGNRKEALRVLPPLVRAGQFMGEEGITINTMIGIVMQSIAARALERYVLNACETPDEIQEAWRELEALNRTEPTPVNPRELSHAMRLMRYERFANFLPEYEWPETDSTIPNTAELSVRYDVAIARFQLLRMGAAARGRQIMQGALPKNAGEFAPLLPGGPPPDPFAPGPLKMVPITGGIACYSVGPDGRDEKGKIAYDPSNGTTSGGDVILEVPEKRQYPFPRGPVKAGSVKEFMAQYPNGLPPDPFADTMGRSLGVVDKPPLCVFSFGPDGDESQSYLPRPQVAYDPTNGTTSAGDLFIEIK